MNLPAKFGLGALTVGTITGISTGLGIYYSNTEEVFEGIKPISEIVETQYDYILLNTKSDDTEWAKILNKYKDANKDKGKREDELKLNNWKSEDDNKLLSDLKQKCEKFWKGRANNTQDKLYKIITNYCARGVTFAEQAKKDNLTVADTNANGKDGNVWTTRQGRFSIIQDDLKKFGFKESGISSGQLREICKEAKEKNKQVKNYNNLYPAFKVLCLK